MLPGLTVYPFAMLGITELESIGRMEKIKSIINELIKNKDELIKKRGQRNKILGKIYEDMLFIGMYYPDEVLKFFSSTLKFDKKNILINQDFTLDYPNTGFNKDRELDFSKLYIAKNILNTIFLLEDMYHSKVEIFLKELNFPRGLARKYREKTDKETLWKLIEETSIMRCMNELQFRYETIQKFLLKICEGAWFDFLRKNPNLEELNGRHIYKMLNKALNIIITETYKYKDKK